MRYFAVQQQRTRKKRVMLVEHSQDPRYQAGIVCYIYLQTADGPMEGGEFYPGYTIEQVQDELEELYALPRSDWIEIPDQLPGCLDDWIAPVRIAVSQTGELLPGQWEQLVEGTWVLVFPTPLEESGPADLA
jgi:hypothetical protein